MVSFLRRHSKAIRTRDGLDSLLILGLACPAVPSTGPISSITIMGGTIVIINDAKIAVELLEKRSVKHSSRPRQVFAGEMYV